MPEFKAGFIIDKKEQANLYNQELNTSFSIIKECCLRGYEVFLISITDLILNNNEPEAIADKIIFEKSFIKTAPGYIRLNDLDIVLLRQEPPIDMNYIFATYILDYVDKSKTLVVNDPSGVRKANEKIYINNFPELVPRNITTSKIDAIKNFLDENGEIIIKPLDNFAGNGVFYLKKWDKNLNTILEMATNNGKNTIMAQEYIKNIKYGDKRLILLGGNPVAAITRVSCNDDFRTNMCKGGYLHKTEITKEDKNICNKISKFLINDGLFFVGLDIVDNKLIEINVTSPGFFIRKINPMLNMRLEEKVVDYMESLITSRKVLAGV